jgi:diguanylate cyclase (GGDEF)-like protein
VLFIDLDGFKAVNDTVGHQAGDELLVQAARRLQESVRSGDTAARLGGDEFAALICGTSADRHKREYQVQEIADRLRACLSEPYLIGGAGAGGELRVAASIGVAFAEPGVTPGELLRNADLAMYRAKQAGKGRVEIYAPQMQADVVRRTELAGRLRAALHDGEFTLLHQPVVDLSTGRIAAVEAQARWRSAQGILFTPAEFLRIADADPGHRGGDRTDRLSSWLLAEAVEQAALRHASGLTTPVAVRLSAQRLMDGPGGHQPVKDIEALLTRHSLPPGNLILELTDQEPRTGPAAELERRLGILRRLGVRIALDGFGAGHAAPAALRTLPVDVVKLDRSFTDGVVESPRLHKITGGLLRIAADLGIRAVADGVDRPEQVAALRSMACTHGLGMAFSGPLDEHRLRSALTRGGYPVPREAVTPAGGPLRSDSETAVPPA